jgi:dihydroxy-acid dehydratase
VNVLLSETEMQTRRDALKAAGGYSYPASQTPWQEMQRGVVGQMDTGSILEPAAKYQRVARTKGIPRHNH